MTDFGEHIQRWRKIKKDYGSVIDIILRTGNVFYRQQIQIPNDIFIKPKVRKYYTSENGNYHTFIFDAYLSKHNMPLRSKCIMFETGPEYIKKTYKGDLYYVIPKSNSPLCYINSSDLWSAFNDKIVNIEVFNNLIDILSNNIYGYSLSSYNEIVQFFTTMYQMSQEKSNEYETIIKSTIAECLDTADYSYGNDASYVNILYDTMINIKPNVRQWLENDVFDLNNRFNMTTPEILCKKFPSAEIEVWTNSECLMIPSFEYTEFIAEYEIYKLDDKY